jgi:hypothetical protein
MPDHVVSNGMPVDLAQALFAHTGEQRMLAEAQHPGFLAARLDLQRLVDEATQVKFLLHTCVQSLFFFHACTPCDHEFHPFPHPQGRVPPARTSATSQAYSCYTSRSCRHYRSNAPRRRQHPAAIRRTGGSTLAFFPSATPLLLVADALRPGHSIHAGAAPRSALHCPTRAIHCPTRAIHCPSRALHRSRLHPTATCECEQRHPAGSHHGAALRRAQICHPYPSFLGDSRTGPHDALLRTSPGWPGSSSIPSCSPRADAGDGGPQR